MSRLTWRQRLIAIVVGGIVAAVEVYGPAPRLAHAAANIAPAAICSPQAPSRC